MSHIKWSVFLLALMFSGAVFGAADEEVVASVDYFYAQDGTLIGRAVNGVRVNYEYDKRGQLLAVKDADGKDLERYTYDPAGNRLSKTVKGITTTGWNRQRARQPAECSPGVRRCLLQN